MPNAQNDYLADFLTEDLGWFESQQVGDLPSDNWRYVVDSQGRTGILYIVLRHIEYDHSEILAIPNEPDALARLAEYHQKLPPPRIGPFLALAHVSGRIPKIAVRKVQIWNIADKIGTGARSLNIDELGEPDLRYPRVRRQA